MGVPSQCTIVGQWLGQRTARSKHTKEITVFRICKESSLKPVKLIRVRKARKIVCN
jgi:hypothetical protein